jgi:hypothetical protein
MVDPPCLVPAVPLAIWWKMLVTSHRQAKHCWSTHCIQCGHICTWYIPCICRCPTYTWYIHGISMVILCISISGYTMYIHRNGCTWYIHGYTMYIHTVYTSTCISIEMDIHGISMDIPCISTQYILVHGISMDIHGYTWYIIWCIYMVYMWYIHGYFWIFQAFWNQILMQASAAGLIQCAHVCGWSRVFYSTRHHGNCDRGKGSPQKAQPCCSQPFPSVACGSCVGGGVGGATGVFPFS